MQIAVIDDASPSEMVRLAATKAFEGVRESCRSRCRTLRYQGLGALLWHFAVDCIAPLGTAKDITLYEAKFDQLPLANPNQVEAVLTCGSESDAEAIAAQIAADFRISQEEIEPMSGKVRKRFRLGQKCFLAILGRKIVHYTWIAFDHCPSVMDRFVVLNEDEAYLAWAFTVEPWRGRGLYPTVSAQVLRLLREQGYKRVYAIVDTSNRSSRKGLERAGWKTCGRLLCFQPRWNAHAWIQPFGRKEHTSKFIHRPTTEMLSKFGENATNTLRVS